LTVLTTNHKTEVDKLIKENLDFNI